MIADFYLGIARQELEQLNLCTGPITVGSDGYSEHVRYAVVATVFSAFAVEYAITELVWIKCFLQTPEPHRKKSVQLALMIRSIPDKLEFLRINTEISDKLLKDMELLFQHRNRLVHLRNKEVHRYVGGGIGFEEAQALVDQGRGPELDAAIESALSEEKLDDLQQLADEVGVPTMSLTLPGLSTEVPQEAEENFGIAQTALKALREEWDANEN